MNRFLAWGMPLALTTAVSFAVAAAEEPEKHAADILRWRQERVAELTKPDGWLTLIGLHFLRAGPNTVGSAKDCDVVLAKGPPYVGTVTIGGKNRTTIEVPKGADVRVDGRKVRRAVLSTDEKNPTVVSFGTVSFFAMERSGRIALRVKDSAAERLTRFAGLVHFPIDPSWRIMARWVAFERSRLTPIANIIGQTGLLPVPGKAVFEREGKTFELLAIDEGPDEPLFFVFRDATSGRETYGAARFLYVDRPKGETIVLDFNRAENPPCAFTPFSTCPLPPKENVLPFAIRAGEMVYRSPD